MRSNYDLQIAYTKDPKETRNSVTPPIAVLIFEEVARRFSVMSSGKCSFSIQREL